MNCFNLQDLEKRLSENSVSDKEGYYYLLANLILFGLTSYSTADAYNHSEFLFAEIVIMLAITIIGLNLTFKANENGDGNEYLKRFLSLYFVIGIRLIVFTLLLAIPVGLLGYLLFSESINNKTVQDVLYLGLYSGLLLIYFYFLVNSFKKIAQARPTT